MSLMPLSLNKDGNCEKAKSRQATLLENFRNTPAERPQTVALTDAAE
jgi:hypothetical protein